MNKTRPATPEVLAIRKLGFRGDIVPREWNERIGYYTKNGKYRAHYLAIAIAARLTYYYRPKEEMVNGKLMPPQSRFDGRYVRKNYAELADEFSCSEAEAKDAVLLLEFYGLFERKMYTPKGYSKPTLHLVIVPAKIDQSMNGDWPIFAQKITNGKYKVLIPNTDRVIIMGGHNYDTQGGHNYDPFIEYSTKTILLEGDNQKKEDGTGLYDHLKKWARMLEDDAQVELQVGKFFGKKISSDRMKELVAEFLKTQIRNCNADWTRFSDCRKHFVNWVRVYNHNTRKHNGKDAGNPGKGRNKNRRSGRGGVFNPDTAKQVSEQLASRLFKES